MRIKHFILALLLFLCYQGFSYGQDLLNINGRVIMTIKLNGDVVEPGSEHVKLHRESDGTIRPIPTDSRFSIRVSNDSIWDEVDQYMGCLLANNRIADLNGDVIGSIETTDSGKVIKDGNGHVIGRVQSRDVADIFLAYYYYFFLPEYRGL